MKKLVIYYSLEGNTHFLAESIADCINADILRLKPKKDIKNNKLKYLIGGKQASTKKKPELHSYDINPTEYELIIIGTPVWAFNMTPAVRSFLHKEHFKNKKIGLFITNRGGSGKTVEHIKKLLLDNDILGTMDMKEPIKGQDTQRQVACKWAQELIDKVNDS